MIKSLEFVTDKIDYIYNFKMVEGFECVTIPLKNLGEINK